MTMLQRTLTLIAILLLGVDCIAADEPVAADSPAADSPAVEAKSIPPLETVWEAQAVLNVDRDKVAHIVNDEDVVFVQSTAGVVTAINAETGREMWTTQVGRTDEVAMPATSNAGIVMIVAGPKLYAMDKFTGRQLFSYRLNSQPSAGPVITEGSFLVPLSDTSVAACSLKTLQYLERYQKLPSGVAQPIAWRFVTGEVIKVAPVAGASRCAFVTDTGNVFVVDIGGGQSGKSKFQLLLQSQPTAPLTLVSRDQEYLFAAVANNRLYCIGLNTNGRMQWTYPLGQRVSEPITVIDQDVFVVGDEGELMALGLKSGLPRQTTSAKPFVVKDVKTLVSVSENAVYIFDSSGRLLTVDRKSGEVVATTEFPGLNVPIRNSVTDRLYLSSTSGRVVCLKESGIDFPIYHQNPKRSPIMPEIAEPAPAAEPVDVNN